MTRQDIETKVRKIFDFKTFGGLVNYLEGMTKDSQ